jgi:hypothetical protein
MELLATMEFPFLGPHKFARPEAGMTGGGQRVAKRFTLMFGLRGWDRDD